ncbi:hypothetical protein [Endozoicomonas numazuensis]|nr:hypothetical protein [Endozoicomonas numazuensis]
MHQKKRHNNIQNRYLDNLIDNEIPVVIKLLTQRPHRYDVLIQGYDGSNIITKSVSGKKVGQMFPMSSISEITPKENFVRPDLPEEQRVNTAAKTVTQSKRKAYAAKYKAGGIKKVSVVKKRRRVVQASL